jgi:uncharacterized membrane protein
MDFFLMVFRSPGYIFGPLMLLAGLAAVALCLRATFRPDRASARRVLFWSLVPPVLGVVGAIVGAVVLALADQPGKDWAEASKYLGCTILFGVFVAVIPALWSLVLLQRRPTVMA